MAQAYREDLLDEAIAAFRAMLVDRPELVRVRLELGRAFFLKGQDGLSRRHFEQVLAGDPPQPVVYNVRRFLSQIRARRRWDMHAGFSLAPDTNIGATSDERTIFINVGGARLPFRRDADELTTSGIGLSLWTGGEYQYPLGEGLRFRAGANLSRREYSGSRFDQTFLSGHAGPRRLLGRSTEASALASAAAELERRRAQLRRPGVPPRGRASVLPAGDGAGAGLVARPHLPDAGPSRRAGHGRLAQRRLGGDAHGAGGRRAGLGAPADRAGAVAPRLPAGYGPAFPWPCPKGSPWAAAASCG